MRANIDADQQRQERRVQIAATYLRESGITVLDTNWDGPDGRLPIIAADRRVLVAVIVRAIDTTQVLSRSTERQMRRMVVSWMTSHGVLFDRVRVDVISVRLDQFGHCLEHGRGDTR